VKIGTLKWSANACSGFSYIEVLISFLILASGLLACGLLIARVQLTQMQVTQTFSAGLMADYMRTQLMLYLENSGSVEAEIFYPDHQLLEGYRATDFDVDDDNPLGCIRFDSSLSIYTIGIFFPRSGELSTATLDCADNSFQAVNRYRALGAENLSGMPR
jgi:hypothetical protein